MCIWAKSFMLKVCIKLCYIITNKLLQSGCCVNRMIISHVRILEILGLYFVHICITYTQPHCMCKEKN